MKENTALRYVHQDHLTGTSLMTDTSGDQIQTTMKYLPFGLTRSGSVPTDKLFTGQRLDDIGLYYYNARYYDPTIGRFISPDTIVPLPSNPQSFNRYSYCLNNPLKSIDPSGHDVHIYGWDVGFINDLLQYAIYLPPEITQALGQVVNSPEYQTYQELRQDEPVKMISKETSDAIWQLTSLVEPREDEHGGNHNTAYLISSEEDIERYRWNADPALWQDPQWQYDHFFQIGNKIAPLGRIAKGGVEICGGLIVGLFGVADLVGGTVLTGGWGGVVTVPTGLYFIGQGYNIIAVGVSDISLGTINAPTIPWLPEP
jgi:RHS repeat-associated protein